MSDIILFVAWQLPLRAWQPLTDLECNLWLFFMKWRDKWALTVKVQPLYRSKVHLEAITALWSSWEARVCQVLDQACRLRRGRWWGLDEPPYSKCCSLRPFPVYILVYCHITELWTHESWPWTLWSGCTKPCLFLLSSWLKKSSANHAYWFLLTWMPMMATIVWNKFVCNKMLWQSHMCMYISWCVHVMMYRRTFCQVSLSSHCKAINVSVPLLKLAILAFA